MFYDILFNLGKKINNIYENIKFSFYYLYDIDENKYLNISVIIWLLKIVKCNNRISNIFDLNKYTIIEDDGKIINKYNCNNNNNSLKIIKKIKYINNNNEIELKELKECFQKIDHDINLSFLLLFFNNIHYFENSNIEAETYFTQEPKNTKITKELLLKDVI